MFRGSCLQFSISGFLSPLIATGESLGNCALFFMTKSFAEKRILIYSYSTLAWTGTVRIGLSGSFETIVSDARVSPEADDLNSTVKVQ